MPSFTSNSNARIPTNIGIRDGMATLAVFAALIVAAELCLRAYGVWPSVGDSTLLWAMHRDRARGDNVIVILGSSRALLGIDPSVIQKRAPNHEVLHLAIDGTSPYAVLDHLSRDTSFRGVILCEATADFIMPRAQQAAQPWVDFYDGEYRHWGTVQKRLDEWARVKVQSALVLASPPLGLSSMVREGPYKSYTHMQPSRFRPAHYLSRVPSAWLASHRAQRVETARRYSARGIRPDAEAYGAALRDYLRPINERLAARGAHLILVRLPTSGDHWVLDESTWSKALYWDRIEPETGIATLHFIEDEVLRAFECPDTSHLDADDAPRFTARLMDLIAKQTDGRAGSVVPAR